MTILIASAACACPMHGSNGILSAWGVNPDVGRDAYLSRAVCNSAGGIYICRDRVAQGHAEILTILNGITHVAGFTCRKMPLGFMVGYRGDADRGCMRQAP
ncbi:hypothetical protein [Polymorphobacter megasporae]|uniref:hypothetical protein n=1 Tax=Glacieibacterium megasporae TaxID=2835787 RepID=UPI001C1E36B2|nr:hypothetical protein [Polymorphobacter megasporae]UAJ10550.1 hypothetical protein KTC28_01945 [Polymorphobacter megasporae]